MDPTQLTIAEASEAIQSGRLSPVALTEAYLERIAALDGELHSYVLVLRDEALAAARVRTAETPRSPLHGIPIALKDNIHTTEMRTTGGALAFEDLVPPYEATITKNLKDAGAIIIAKTGMTELANWVAGAPTPMPGNYNAVGGQG